MHMCIEPSPLKRILGGEVEWATALSFQAQGSAQKKNWKNNTALFPDSMGPLPLNHSTALQAWYPSNRTARHICRRELVF